MGYPVSQANTLEPLRFLMVLSSDHITGATGKVCTVTLAKNGGSSFLPPVGVVTELGNGWYSVSPNAADASSLGPLLLHATAAGCDPTDDVFDVVSYNPTSFSPISGVMGPHAVPAIDILNDAFDLIGVRSQGETLSPADAQNGLRRLNQLISQWILLPLTMTSTTRTVFALVPGKGTPLNPYTVGTGGDLDIPRPAALIGAGILVSTGSGLPFELTRTIYTDAAYQALGIKTLLSTYFAGVYYNATYSQGFGTLFLYPIPTQANSLVLYTESPIAGFADLTTPYDLPPGAIDAITYELARRLAPLYQRAWSPDLAKDASDYLAIFQRANTRMVDLNLDPALTSESTKRWDIFSDA